MYAALKSHFGQIHMHTHTHAYILESCKRTRIVPMCLTNVNY